MTDTQPGAAPFRPRKVHVVSHTHWDREWYLTFQEFRVNLTHVVEQVLDALENDPDFEHFLLDGQAIVLEDHLAVCPEDEERIKRHVASGALQVGPWYMLPDEFLVSGESLVRNLLVGHAICERLGGAQTVGYMADSFGHPAQIPQILREGGLDSFVYTRGNGSELEETGHEYLWESPDGSQVTAIQQCGGYCAGAGLGHEEIWHAHTRRAVQIPLAVDKVRKWFDEIGRLSNGDVVLMNNGCDHFPPQRELGRVLTALRAEFPEVEFVHSTLEKYLDDVRSGGFATTTFSGELCQGRYFHILSGVWSARMYLKQRNDIVQRRLADVEAVCAYTHFAHERHYPAGTLLHCWKELLKNHPHDSICGCSTDEVHRDMIPRFDESQRTAEQVIRRELEHLAPTFAEDAKDDRDTVLCVFNPLPYRRTETIRRLVVLQPFGVDPDDLQLLDEDGNEVPMRILERHYVERFWGVDYRVMLDTAAQRRKLGTYMDAFRERFVKTPADRDTADCFLLLEMDVELPALAHANLRLTAQAAARTREARPRVDVGERTIENDVVHVTVTDNGTLAVLDKRSGRVRTGLALFEDTGDCGDEYDFSPVGPTMTSAGCELDHVDAAPELGELRFELILRLPMCLDERDRGVRRAGWGDELQFCHVNVTLRLTPQSPVIDVHVNWSDWPYDHRLRLHFPSLVRSEAVYSDGHFYVNERSIHRPDDDEFVQPNADTFPHQDFSIVQDDEGGMAVLVRGLPEVAPLASEAGSLGLAVTLIRSVGWLSRDDFPTRRNQNAGPTIETREAQGILVSEDDYHLALVPFSGDWRDAGIRRLSERWRRPPLVIQGVEDGEQPSPGDFLTVDDPLVSVTAIKRHEERDTLVVRMFNDTSQPRDAVVRLGPEVSGAWRVDLLERRQGELTVAGEHDVIVPLRKHGIATVEIAIRSQDNFGGVRR